MSRGEDDVTMSRCSVRPPPSLHCSSGMSPDFIQQYTTFQTYNYHLQINLTLAPRFLINYLMRRINGHKENSTEIALRPRKELVIGCRGTNVRRDTALHGVNVSLFHSRSFLSGGRCLTWNLETLLHFEAQTATAESRQHNSESRRGDRGY